MSKAEENNVGGMDSVMESGAKKSKKLWTAVLVVVVVLAAAWLVYGWWTGKSPAVFGADKYQAVFLDNNQVYFGKLSRENSGYAVLRDIYYLRLGQTLQPPTSANQIPDVNLVKLGTELHGPEDEMRINKEHIIFIEDLKDDSQIVQGIKSFQEFQKQQ
ncbi:MAG: hypothetical protein AAB527_01815 [Patescibacteria group bacterium]